MRATSIIFFTIIFFTIILASSTVGQAQTELPKPRASVVWKTQPTEQERNDLLSGLAVTSNQRLVAIELICNPQTHAEAEFHFVSLNLDGEQRLREPLIKRPEQMITPPVTPFGFIVPEVAGAVMAFGRFDDERTVSMLKLSPEGNIQWNRKIAEGTQGNTFQARKMPGGRFVILSVDGGSSIVTCVDSSGKRLWEKKYTPPRTEQERPFDALASPDSRSVLLLGQSGEVNKFGLGKTEIVIRSITPDGELIREHRFPGRMPAGYFLPDGTLLLRYDSSFTEQVTNHLCRLGQDFAALWDQRVAPLEATGWVWQPSLLVDSEHVRLIGAVDKDLILQTWDMNGASVWRTTVPLGVPLYGVEAISSGDRAFVSVVSGTLVDGKSRQVSLLLCLKFDDATAK